MGIWSLFVHFVNSLYVFNTECVALSVCASININIKFKKAKEKRISEKE